MKKILTIEILNPELSIPEIRQIRIGMHPNSDKNHLVDTFVNAVVQFPVRDLPEEGAFLFSLIISASESIKKLYPDIAASIRKAVIEDLKKMNNEKDGSN